MHPDIRKSSGHLLAGKNQELMTTDTSKRGLENLIVSVLTGLPLGGGLGSPDHKAYRIKHIGTARVLLQRLDNKHLIPLLYFVSKWFFSKGFSKATMYGWCCCPVWLPSVLVQRRLLDELPAKARHPRVDQMEGRIYRVFACAEIA